MIDIDHVVKKERNIWKNVYLLHKPSDFLVSISDKNDENNQEKDEEGNDEEITHFIPLIIKRNKRKRPLRKECKMISKMT